MFSKVIWIIVPLVRQGGNSFANLLNAIVASRKEVYEINLVTIKLLNYPIGFSGNCVSKSACFSNINAN